MKNHTLNEENKLYIAASVNGLTDIIHMANLDAGWWHDEKLEEFFPGPDNLKNFRIMPYVAGTKIALSHSEISEALEGMRKGIMDDHLPHRPMIEVELADAIIRILDIAGALNLDVGGALVEKFNYNQTRADHKPEARQAEGGKSI